MFHAEAMALEGRGHELHQRSPGGFNVRVARPRTTCREPGVTSINSYTVALIT